MARDRSSRSGGDGGEHDPADDNARAPGTSARTDRLPPSKKRTGSNRDAAHLDGARRSIEKLGKLADQLDAAIAARNFFRAREVASSMESLRLSMMPTLADVARSGADPDALAALEADAAQLSGRLDKLIPQAPDAGLAAVDPAVDAAHETAWLASLPGAPTTAASPDGAAQALAPREGDPLAFGRFADAALGVEPDPQPIGGTIDPGAASAQLDDATGTVDDEPLIEWQDVKRAALTGPFLAAPRNVQDALTGPLAALLRKRETIHLVINPTRDPIKHVVADVLADLANDPAFTIGFTEGALTGTIRAVYDTLKGFHDAGKLVQEILLKLATFQHREVLAQGKRAIDDLTELIKDAPGLLEEFVKRWRATDSYTRGQFQGEVLGYILTQIAIIIAGSITGGPAMAGPFANVIKVLNWVDNPIAGLAEMAAEAKLSTAALEALHAGQGIRSIEPLADARAASRTFGAVDDAAEDLAATRRPMAHADGLAEEVSPLRRAQALAEINTIHVGQIRKGEAPGVERDTLYIARVDGNRFPDLLRTLKPDVQILPYKKGLLVRSGAKEWWFEYSDQAAQLERAPTIGVDHGGLGLPEPNVATVDLVAYSGVRKIHGRPEAEWTAAERADVDEIAEDDPLAKAGHVAISFDGGRTYYGMTPVTGDMQLADVIAKLKAGDVFPGQVLDDTDHFTHARELASEKGWNTEPTRAVVAFDRTQQPEIFESVLAAKAANARGENPLAYGWPSKNPENGQPFKGGTAPDGREYGAECVNNCATYPATVGVPIPETTGLMQDYMRELRIWAAADAPIDGNHPPAPKGPKR